MAEVQLFCTHGNIDNIEFLGTAQGIKTGESKVNDYDPSRKKFGIEDMVYQYWTQGTKLVTYMTCNGGGTNGIASNNSIVYHSVDVGGVDVCVGFKKEISYSDGAVGWSRNYNMHLADGYGVADSMDYANSFSYNDNRVHSTYLVYNSSVTTQNMKIGRYAETSNYTENDSIKMDYIQKQMDKRNILKESKNIECNTNNDKEIYNLISLCTENTINENNYKISRNTSTISDANTGKTEETEYIDVRLYIGDFYTNAAYNVVAKKGKVIAIYDNNIDIKKQNEELKKIEEYKITEEMRNNINEKDETIKYFYDIENDKKYYEVTYRDEIIGEDGMTSIAVDTKKYEI